MGVISNIDSLVREILHMHQVRVKKMGKQSTLARKLLKQKAREIVGLCGGAGVGAVLVTDGGDNIIAAAEGIRKVGSSGAQNNIQVNDRWCLGSISKPFTGTAIGIMIQKGVGGLTWKTKLGEVFPEVAAMPGAQAQYFDVPLELFMAHASGLPYNPKNEPADFWFPEIEALGLTDSSLMNRRVKFVHAAVLDKPLFKPGEKSEYGGGTIICAAMFERKTGKRFERLLKEHVYTPLGMTNSGYGVTSPGALDGPWQHKWDDDDYKLVPAKDAHKPAYNYNSHGVAGFYCVSAGDMGKFIRENLRTDPQVMAAATRSSVQSVLPAAGSVTTRGAWVCNNPTSPSTADIWHSGDDGRMYADLILHRSAKWGSAAFSNVNNRFGTPTVYDMQNVMNTMVSNWTALFGGSGSSFVECVHPTPALVQAGGAHWVFARKHTGALVRTKMLSASAQNSIEFPSGVYNSGVTSAASADGKVIHVIARGKDNHAWRVISEDGGATWRGPWQIPTGVFVSGLAVATSSNGKIVHLFGIGADNKLWRSKSSDFGASWIGWTAVGEGVFTSPPAAACSLDGKVVHVFARGMDFRIWINKSSNGGNSWKAHWAPIGKGIFTSGPAADCNNSGSKVYVTARGTDRAPWYNVTTNGASSWAEHWTQIPDGTFNSAPAFAVSPDGLVLTIILLGGDHCIYKNRSTNGGDAWSGWSRMSADFYL